MAKALLVCSLIAIAIGAYVYSRPGRDHSWAAKDARFLSDCHRFATKAIQYRETNGEWPPSLPSIFGSSRIGSDPWSHEPYSYILNAEGVPVVRSGGPDGVHGTEDDRVARIDQPYPSLLP